MATGSWYKYYVLALLLSAHLLCQLVRYMLAITIKPIAQDLHFGEQNCQLNKTFEDKGINPKLCEIRNYTSCENFPASYNSSKTCIWEYDGQGIKYQVLVGPVFTVVFTVTGVAFGFLEDGTNRKVFLTCAIMVWSAVTILSGFVTSYWQLVVLRMGLGIGEAGCTPFSTSLIADYFPKARRGLALGIYNLGIYIGYSLSFALGNFVTSANILGQGWRWAFIVSGLPGIVLSIVFLVTVKDPNRIHPNTDHQSEKKEKQPRKESANSETAFNYQSTNENLYKNVVGKNRSDSYNTFENNPDQTSKSSKNSALTISKHGDNGTTEAFYKQCDNKVFTSESSEGSADFSRNTNSNDKSNDKSCILEQNSTTEQTAEVGRFSVLKTIGSKLANVLKAFLNPSLLLLVVAGSVRNSAGMVWAYNTQQYFTSEGQTPEEIGAYMSWFPMAGGSIGVVLGGYISDKVVRNRGTESRILLVLLSQVLSIPFAAVTLMTDPPTAYYFQIPAFIIGEMWVGVTLTVVVELVPVTVRTATVAVYMFISNNFAGLVPLAVPLLRQTFKTDGYTKADAFKDTLYILYPGLISVGAVLFFVTVFVLRKDRAKNRTFSVTEIDVKPPQTIN